MEGIPLALKDNFCLSKTVTTAGSKLLSNYVPPYDATIVSRLQQAGAVIIGKTNMDEFSMGSSSITGANGPVVNPWGVCVLLYIDQILTALQTQCVAGGSSGGSAAAVAARVCYGAMGSDTGGSVRLPAAYCGVVGLKPSYGRVSRWGLISYASSLDTPGVLARSVPDAATILEVISGIDTHDSSSIPEQPLSKTLDKRKTLEGVRIGIPKEYHVQELDLDTVKVWETAAKQLLEAGAEVFEVSLPHTSDALLAYYILATAEAASNLARYDGLRFGDTGYKKTVEELQNITANDIYLSTRNKGFGEEVQRRIILGIYDNSRAFGLTLILGTHVLSRDSYESYYRKAQQIRRLVLQDFTSVFEQGVDMLLTPTAPQAAYPITSSLRPHQYYTQDIMTVPASMAGLPAISLPVNLDAKYVQLPITKRKCDCIFAMYAFSIPLHYCSGMPIAVQLIAPPHADVDLISIANCIESLFLRTAA